MRKHLFAVPALAVTGLAGLATPTLASSAETSADWFETCSVVTVESSKDISNVVYQLDGEHIKIELEEGTNHLILPGDATDVWVKSGNNSSGDGSGYGEHFARPETCETDSSTVPPTDEEPATEGTTAPPTGEEPPSDVYPS